MGKICTCNQLDDENCEFYGFNNPRKNLDNKIITKKQFNDYDEKDKIFYEKTAEYDKVIKNKLNYNTNNNEPKEYINGTVKIIRI